MASESGMKGSSSSSNAGESYIGSFISLISKYEIRYEGVLYYLDIQDSTIGLKNVRSYGTEGRRKDGPQIPPSEKVYEYILFRGNDIKDLQVKSPTTSARGEEQIFCDPAIIQSRYSVVPSSSSPLGTVGGRSFAESIQRKDTPAMNSRAIPVGLASHQSVTLLGPSDQSCAIQVAAHPSFSEPLYWQGHGGLSSNSSYSLQQSSPHQPPSTVSPLIMQNWIQAPETQAPTKLGWTLASECGIPVSSATASSLVNPICSPSTTSLQISDALDIPSLMPNKSSMQHSASMISNGNISLYSSTFQDLNLPEGQISDKISPDLGPVFPRHSVHHSASSFVDSTSRPLLTPPSLLTPDQFAQPRPHFSSLTQNLTSDEKDVGQLMPPSSCFPFKLVPSPVSQAPLLPLPTLVQKPEYSASQYTEEFDFAAMNEKFKKDEVWGSLGKATEKVEGVKDNASAHSLGDGEGRGLIPNHQPAYKKDDFFDTISCNSLARGLRNGQNRLSERMKLDTETFGNFQRRPNVGYFAYGAGRGENYGATYDWRKGYGYGGRGRGRNLPF